jgi:hypothetical protein
MVHLGLWQLDQRSTIVIRCSSKVLEGSQILLFQFGKVQVEAQLNCTVYIHLNHEIKWLCRDNMVIFETITVKGYENQSVWRIVVLVGLLWWEGWLFARGLSLCKLWSNCMDRLLCVLGWCIV